MSTNKIVALVVFFCAAIMTSMFLMHMKPQSSASILTADEGLVFPAPREIKEFNLVAADKIFTQDDLRKHWTLLFFGFTHCSSVCPTTLGVLNSVYQKLQASYPNLQVVLVSVDPERDTPASLEKYAHSFNPAFTGVTGKTEDLRKLQAQLGIYSARDESTPNTNYQVLHTSSIMLINPKGEWAAMYKYGLPAAQLAAAIEKTIQAAQR